MDTPAQDRAHDIRVIQASYDRIAEEYTRRMLNEFDHKPLDQELLDRFARGVAGKGPVCDLGCGPGQVARYLQARGVDIFGLDLSPAMLEEARRANPGISFRQGDMGALDMPDASLAGVAAFYSILHTPREKVTDVLRGIYRVLQPGGILLLAFHLGSEVVHVDDMWEHRVSLDFTFFGRAEMEEYLLAAGFIIDESIERPPYPEVEYPSHRAYVFAVKPVS